MASPVSREVSLKDPFEEPQQHGLGGDFHSLAVASSHPLCRGAFTTGSFSLPAQVGDVGDLGGSNVLKLCRASWHG